MLVASRTEPSERNYGTGPPTLGHDVWERMSLDNLGSHKDKMERILIRSARAKLFFLPKYSPDLSPIEQVSAKLKHLLRRAGVRTIGRSVLPGRCAGLDALVVK